MQLVHIDRPEVGQEATDIIRSFVFMANLEAQEASGDVNASATVEQVLTRLKGSSESDVVLIAAVDETVTPVLAPAGPLGLPLVPATGSREVDLEVLAYLHISLPLLEDVDLAELDITLDAAYLPLPGEPMEDKAHALRDELLGRGAALARDHFQRSRFLVWTDDTEPAPPSDFVKAVTVEQTVMAVPEGLELDDDTVIVSSYGADSPYAADIAELLTQASIDTDHGSLKLEPQLWSPTRLVEAAARLKDRRDEQFMSLVLLDGEVIALSEVTLRDEPDASVAELGMTATKRGFRSEGFGRQALKAVISELAWRHPQVKKMYGSAAATDAAAWAMYSPFAPELIDRATGWMKG